MYFSSLTSFLVVGAVVVQASAFLQASPNNIMLRALGINCRGSILCRNGDMLILKAIVNNIDEGRLYDNGFHIACVRHSGGNGACAFLQNSDHRVSGGVIKLLINGLVDHGCKGCGSNPVYNYGGSPSNDPQWGILTVNYVSKTDNPCDGLC